MKLPVDDTTLTAWASLLGLTEQQTTDALKDIEHTLRLGYARRPTHMRHLSFEELSADMDVDELALMFLVNGLRQAGYPDAAHAVEIRGLIAHLQSAPQDD